MAVTPDCLLLAACVLATAAPGAARSARPLRDSIPPCAAPACGRAPCHATRVSLQQAAQGKGALGDAAGDAVTKTALRPHSLQWKVKCKSRRQCREIQRQRQQPHPNPTHRAPSPRSSPACCTRCGAAAAAGRAWRAAAPPGAAACRSTRPAASGPAAACSGRAKCTSSSERANGSAQKILTCRAMRHGSKQPQSWTLSTPTLTATGHPGRPGRRRRRRPPPTPGWRCCRWRACPPGRPSRRRGAGCCGRGRRRAGAAGAAGPEPDACCRSPAKGNRKHTAPALASPGAAPTQQVQRGCFWRGTHAATGCRLLAWQACSKAASKAPCRPAHH